MKYIITSLVPYCHKLYSIRLNTVQPTAQVKESQLILAALPSNITRVPGSWKSSSTGNSSSTGVEISVNDGNTLGTGVTETGRWDNDGLVDGSIVGNTEGRNEGEFVGSSVKAGAKQITDDAKLHTPTDISKSNPWGQNDLSINVPLLHLTNSLHSSMGENPVGKSSHMLRGASTVVDV